MARLIDRWQDRSGTTVDWASSPETAGAGQQRNVCRTLVTRIAGRSVLAAIVLALATPAAALNAIPALDVSGTGLTLSAGGVGLGGDPGPPQFPQTLSVDIGGPVLQATLYWSGVMNDASIAPGDAAVTLNGLPVNGALAGDEVVEDASGLDRVFAFGADVTGIVQGAGIGPAIPFVVGDGDPGNNASRLSGVSLVVLYEDLAETRTFRVIVFDGLDYVFDRFAVGPRFENAVTEPVTFFYGSDAFDRSAEILTIAGLGEELRSERLAISDNADVLNAVDSSDDPQWDTDFFAVQVPAGIDATTLQYFSESIGALSSDSVAWVLAALRLPEPVLGMVGDLVFEDLDGDGLQCRDGVNGPLDGVCQPTEPLDPGIPDVKVNLVSACDDPADDIDPNDPAAMQRTDDTGFYKFTDLPPSCKYTVSVDPCNFVGDPGAICGDGAPAGALAGFTPAPPQVGDDICHDSGGRDAQGQPVSGMAMTFLPLASPFAGGQSELNDPCLDFGYTLADCAIEVDKTCCIPPPPAPPTGFNCSDAKPITSLSIVWNGPSGVNVLTEGGESFANVQAGDEITFSTADLGNDVEMSLSGAVSGNSRFHVSCSDDAMNGPEDCGSAQGNGKGDDSSLVNLWLFEGMGGSQALDCTPSAAAEAGTRCLASNGSTGDDCRGDVLEAVFEYTGFACQAPLGNAQGGKAECSGDPGGATATLVATKDEDKIFLNGTVTSVSGIVVGDTISVQKIDKGEVKSLPSDLELNVIGAGTQALRIHASCSQPLNLGDEFGSFRLVELTTTGLGTVVLDPDPVIFEQMCQLLEAPAPPHCTTKVAALTLRYLGGDCSARDNGQDKPEKRCTGDDPGALPISILVTKDDTKVSAVVSDDLVTFSHVDGKLASDTEFDVTGASGTQSLKIHTSCSKPLDLGDRFGAFEVFAIDRTEGAGSVGLGGEVEYQYTISNQDAEVVTISSVFDDQLGELLAPTQTIALSPDSSATLFEVVTIENSVTNVVTVSGTNVVGAQCSAMDTVEVELVQPPPAPFVCSDAKPITALSLTWNGPGGANVVTEGGEVFQNLQTGDEIRVSTSDLGNDVDLEITGSIMGTSRFHVSCSDDAMNGPEDCGSAQGDGKDDASGRINLWLFEGMDGERGSLDCSDLP